MSNVSRENQPTEDSPKGGVAESFVLVDDPPAGESFHKHVKSSGLSCDSPSAHNEASATTAAEKSLRDEKDELSMGSKSDLIGGSPVSQGSEEDLKKSDTAKKKADEAVSSWGGAGNGANSAPVPASKMLKDIHQPAGAQSQAAVTADGPHSNPKQRSLSPKRSDGTQPPTAACTTPGEPGTLAQCQPDWVLIAGGFVAIGVSVFAGVKLFTWWRGSGTKTES